MRVTFLSSRALLLIAFLATASEARFVLNRVDPNIPVTVSGASKWQLRDDHGRKLAEDPPFQDMIFNPLVCNANVDEIPLDQCGSFKDEFMPISGDDPVTIDCGTCYIMDVDEDSLRLPNGLDIQGRLVFTDGFKLEISTPYIFVQGLLEIENTHPISPENEAVKFVFTDNRALRFTPHPDNEGACDYDSCPVGSKAFVVAGGRVNIRGMPSECPSWVKLVDVEGGSSSTVDTIVVDASVIDCWGVGSEVLVTSHTNQFNRQQVAKIVDVTAGGAFASIQLDDSIRRPTTLQDSADYAVEVALLKRNIVFEAAKDSGDRLIGGHTMVMFTPGVAQHLEGAEFVHMGQQGILGKYPIHFHMCFDAHGSKVTKNVIRDSPQRCVVIHGTDKVEISDNVAFNTAGHCYMNEDGGERRNKFIRNLGALTTAVDRSIGRDETDEDPSTFWLANPDNDLIGNVAAGCEGTGFWQELRPAVRGLSSFVEGNDYDPMRIMNGEFRDNVAHSNLSHGFAFYPEGYFPPEEVVYNNCLSYRNFEDGVFSHASWNFAFEGGIMADNGLIGVDIDGVDNYRLEDMKFIGMSEHFKKVVDEEDLPLWCTEEDPDHTLTGVQGRWFTFDKLGHWTPGGVFRNLRFEGFTDTLCSSGVAFRYNNFLEASGVPHFDYFTQMQGVSLEAGTPVVDACSAYNREDEEGDKILSRVEDLIWTDLDSGLGGSSTFKGSSSIVSNKPWMTTFVADKCTEVASLCYSYCEDTCLRTLTYRVDAYDTEDFVLEVTDGTKQIEVDGIYFQPTLQEQLELFDDVDFFTTLYDNHRYFSATLPQGSYTAAFKKDGNLVSPSFVEKWWEPAPDCPNHLQEGTVELMTAPVTEEYCSELVRNGDGEGNNCEHWYHFYGGVECRSNQGVDGSTAIVSNRREGTDTGLIHYLDTRCLAFLEGRELEFTGMFHLESEDGSVRCNPRTDEAEEDGCPMATLWLQNRNGPVGDFSESYVEGVATIVGQRHTNRRGYQLMRGTFIVTSEMLNADSVMVLIHNAPNEVSIFMDDVSIHPAGSAGELPTEADGGAGGFEGDDDEDDNDDDEDDGDDDEDDGDDDEDDDDDDEDDDDDDEDDDDDDEDDDDDDEDDDDDDEDDDDDDGDDDDDQDDEDEDDGCEEDPDSKFRYKAKNGKKKKRTCEWLYTFLEEDRFKAAQRVCNKSNKARSFCCETCGEAFEED